MAKFVQHQGSLDGQIRELDKKISRYRRAKIYWFLLSLLIYGLAFRLHLPIGIILFFGALIMSARNLFIESGLRNERRMFNIGKSGEMQTRSIFEGLDKRFTVFPDITVGVDGQQSQIDHLIVGPTGVFVVETKHWNGFIEGEADDREVVQHKVGRRGGQYQKAMYNPVRQVKTHVYRVSQAIRRGSRLNVWIQGVVYFSNPDAEVDLSGGNVRVFSARDGGEQNLRSFIENSKEYLSLYDCQEIVKVLEEVIVK